MWIHGTQYLVNLKPLMGVDFRRETKAGSAREALNNVLYYYFGKDRSRLSLYPVSYTHLTLPTTPYV